MPVELEIRNPKSQPSHRKAGSREVLGQKSVGRIVLALPLSRDEKETSPTNTAQVFRPTPSLQSDSSVCGAKVSSGGWRGKAGSDLQCVEPFGVHALGPVDALH